MTDLSRRSILKTALSGLAAVPALSAADRHALDSVGVQLYTVRGILMKDPAAILQAIAQIGYREAEVVWASLEGIGPALKQTALRPVSVHLDSNLFKPENREKMLSAIQTVKQFGFQYAVYPYVPVPERPATIDGFKTLTDQLNKAGADCRDAGLQLCYHNHAFEFQPMGSATPFETMMGQTDKKLVQLEMDVFWVSVAGHDPVALLKQYSGRVPLLHIKNKAAGFPVQFNEKVPPATFREAGNGSIDMKQVLRAAADAGTQHFFVEQDQTPGDPLNSLRQSYDYLKKLKF